MCRFSVLGAWDPGAVGGRVPPGRSGAGATSGRPGGGGRCGRRWIRRMRAARRTAILLRAARRPTVLLWDLLGVLGEDLLSGGPLRPGAVVGAASRRRRRVRTVGLPWAGMRVTESTAPDAVMRGGLRPAPAFLMHNFTYASLGILPFCPFCGENSSVIAVLSAASPGAGWCVREGFGAVAHCSAAR